MSLVVVAHFINYIYLCSYLSNTTCLLPSNQRARATSKYLWFLEHTCIYILLVKRLLWMRFVISWRRVKIFVVSSCTFTHRHDELRPSYSKLWNSAGVWRDSPLSKFLRHLRLHSHVLPYWLTFLFLQLIHKILFFPIHFLDLLL